MNRWEQGRDVIDRLLQAGDLERVPPSREQAESMIAEARRHVASAQRILDVDPAGAYALLYDAARKSVAAILENQGLRGKSQGGHIAIYEAVFAQLKNPLDATLRPFDRMRRRRNQVEYRSTAAPAIDDTEVARDVTKVEAIIEVADRVIPEMPPY